MASRRPVLLLAYHFPPDPSIGSARPYRFFTHLPATGWQPHVMTAAPQNGTGDPRITFVPDPFVNAPGSSFSWQLERLIRRLWIPGHTGTIWSRRAAQSARQWIQDGNRDAVLFSTAPPLGVLLASLWIKRKTGIPWVADFRDPMVLFYGKHPALVRYVERATVEHADIVVVNTPAVAERWKVRYSPWAHKIRVLWNGYDPNDGIAAIPWQPGEVRSISHIGTLYAGRTPDLLVASVERLIAAGRLPISGVKISLIGPMDRQPFDDPALIARAQSAGWLQASNQPIPQSDARGISQKSDVLLLLQPQSDFQVPGKLFEYIRYRRPILAVVPPKSPVEELLALSGIPYRCIYPCQPPETIDDVVYELLTLPKSTIPEVSGQFAQTFAAGPQADTLAQYLQEAADNPKK